MDNVKKSKFLSKVLRHDPDSVGIQLDSAGWTPVKTLLVAVKMSKSELDEVVETNDKKRFEYDESGLLIRASQGHSVEVDLEYTPASPPDYLWHGTGTKTVSDIFANGILKMQRHAVHLSADLAVAKKVATRKGKPAVFIVDAKSMHDAGFKFYVSTNGVWLVDAVPSKYLKLCHD